MQHHQAASEATKLYWVTTADHGDDALVTALTRRGASRVLANDMGCDIEEVSAVLVADLKQLIGITTYVGRVDDDVLRACGAFIAAIGPSRVVYLYGQCFVEGILDFVMQDAARQLGPEGLKEFMSRSVT